MNGLVTTIMIVLIVGVLYFIPSINAHSRKHHNEGAIIATNILLGWTVLGWIIALIWSYTAVRRST